MKLEFPDKFYKKNAQTSSYIKIRPVGAELFHADGQTDMTKLTVAFHNSANRLEKKEQGVPRFSYPLFHRIFAFTEQDPCEAHIR
jgi:hypothetical protein